MANTLATTTWVTNEIGERYVNSIKFISHINRQLDEEFGRHGGAKVGYTVLYRLPQRFLATDGQALQVQPLNDQTVPVTLTNQKNVAFTYSSAQASMELDHIRERYINPAADTLASAADRLAYDSVYRDIYSAVGTPGTTPTTNQTYLNAGVKLSDLGTPLENRFAVLDTLAMANLAGTQATLFNPQSKISSTYNSGMMAQDVLGYEGWFQDQNRSNHVTGTFTASTPIVTPAGQTGSSIATTGWASGASTLNAGDVFTINGVFGTNPLSGQSTGRLQQFVVTATISDTAGAMTIQISPPIIVSGQYQTVTNSPALNSAITVWSANPVGGVLATTQSPVSLVFHKNAFAFVTADLSRDLGGADVEIVRSSQYGFSIRWVQQYQIGTDQNPGRLDILIGAATLQARMAARVQG